jgi:hypothetical protein
MIFWNLYTKSKSPLTKKIQSRKRKIEHIQYNPYVSILDGLLVLRVGNSCNPQVQTLPQCLWCLNTLGINQQK